MRILLVEDSPTLRHAMSRYIEHAGHEAVIAENGEQSLQILEHDLVDLVIMDVEMPGLNGFETTRLIREWLAGHWIPIMFVTGKSDDESFAEGIEAGGDDYLIKPVNPVILKAKIRAMERLIEMRNQLNKLNKELETLSQRDSLTHLYNRRTFNELSTKEWLRAGRTKKSISLLMLDIDHFKQYNDHYGHPAGDRCLIKVSKALEDTLKRPTDIVARYGGEEFVVLLPDTDLAGAEIVAEKLRSAIEDLDIHHEMSDTAEVITTSIGLCSSDYTTGFKIAALFKPSDQLLYKSKADGRNCVSSDTAQQFRSILVADNDRATIAILKKALKNRFNLITTADSEECIELAQEVEPDLILLDIYNTDMDGIKLCKELKNSLSCANVPVLLMASREIDAGTDLSKVDIANGLIKKPLVAEELLELIEQILP